MQRINQTQVIFDASSASDETKCSPTGEHTSKREKFKQLFHFKKATTVDASSASTTETKCPSVDEHKSKKEKLKQLFKIKKTKTVDALSASASEEECSPSGEHISKKEKFRKFFHMKKTTTIDALPASIEEEKCSPVSDTAVEEEKVDALSASIEENKCSPVGGNDARTMNVENIDALSASIEENKCSPVGGNDARTMNVENIDALSASNIENECSPVNGPVAYLDHPEPAANLDEPAENATKPAADNAKPAADNAKPAEPAEPAEPSEYAEYAEYAEPTAYAEPAEYAEYAEPTALAAFAQPTTFAESAIQPQPRPAETNIANSDNYEAYEPRELQTSSSCYSDGQSSSHSLEDRILRRLRESMSPFAIEVEEEEGNADLLSICSNNSDEPQHQYSALGRETPKLVIPKKRGAPTCKADKHGAAISKSPKEPEAVKPNEIVPPIATAVETTRHKEPEAEKPNNVDSSEANRKMERAPSVDSAVDDKKTKKSIARRIVELVQSLVACFRAKPKADPTPPIIAPVRIRTPMTYARVAANYGVWPDHSRVFVLGA